MNEGMLIASIGLVSAMLGGFLQAWSTRRFESLRFKQSNRNDAYLTYVNGLGKLSYSSSDEQRNLALSMISDARSRIALFGSGEVVSAMVTAFSHGNNVESETARNDIANMIAAMRSDSLGEPILNTPEELLTLVYGPQIKAIKE